MDEIERLRAAKRRWSQLADERSMEAAATQVENERLRRRLERLRAEIARAADSTTDPVTGRHLRDLLY
jgi:hypothetical protein